MDVKLTRYPLRDYKSMWSEMHNVVKDYAKIGKRNQHAIEHHKLGKHMMHLIRLYMMCLDILENKEIVTPNSLKWLMNMKRKCSMRKRILIFQRSQIIRRYRNLLWMSMRELSED